MANQGVRHERQEVFEGIARRGQNNDAEHATALAYQDAPVTLEQGALVVEPCASRIPAGPRGSSRSRT